MERPDNRTYLGMGGSGKTFLALHQAALTSNRVLIFDPNGEDQNAAGAHVVTERRQLLELLVRPGPVRVCWRGVHHAESEEELEAAFDWANRCAWAAGNLVLVWDEADRLTGGRLRGKAYAIVHSGRHRDLRLFTCSRRPAGLPRDLTGNTQRFLLFQIEETLDLEYLRPRIGRQVTLELPTLKPRQAYDRQDGRLELKASPFP